MNKQKDPEKRRVGRPSVYKEEYCKMLQDHLASGLMYESFAGELSISIETLYAWERDYPEFSEAKKIGWPKGYLHWDKINKAVCSGMKTTLKDGRVIDPKNIPVAIFIFNMKNRFKWRDNHDVNLTTEKKGITINYKEKKKEIKK
jgi:hypothetical protein